MERRGELHLDPNVIGSRSTDSLVELVVVYTESSITTAVLKKAAELVTGLDARVVLLAVHAVPYPASFASASASHAHLVAELADLAETSPLPVSAQVIMTRDWESGFRSVLRPESTVLLGAPRRLWPSAEERLARTLANDGHKVALLHV